MEAAVKEANIFNEFIKYVSLNILGQMAYSCYTLADTFFVSARLGADGLTALNLAFPIFCLINGTGLMIGMGGGTRYSIARSRGERREADRIFTASLCMATFLGAVFFTTGLFFSDSIVRLLGADDAMFTMTNTYLKVMLLFAPAFLANNLFQCFVRNDGYPSLSMTAMTVASLSNVILDYIFIFPMGMGILGAILATGLAPVISLSVLSYSFIRRKNGFHFAAGIPKRKIMTEIISSGIPPFVTEITSGIVMFLFNFIILRLTGNIGVAAFSIITVISLVVVAIYTGLSQGIQPVMSRNHGAGNSMNVRKILKYALATALVLSVIIYGVVFFGAEQIVEVFNSRGEQRLQSLAETGMKLYFIACPFIGFNIVTATYFVSTEKPGPGQLISLLRGLVVPIPVAFLLSYIFDMTGVWCAYPMSEFLVALAAWFFLANYHLNNHRISSIL